MVTHTINSMCEIEWFPLVHAEATRIWIHSTYTFMIVAIENNSFTLLPYKASIEQLENFFTQFPKGIRETFEEMKYICKNVL